MVGTDNVTQGTVEYTTQMDLFENADGTAQFEQRGGNLNIWQEIQAGFANAELIKDKAYLIKRHSAPPGVVRYDVNTPTTCDRVTA
jgi:hypothetical protein